MDIDDRIREALRLSQETRQELEQLRHNGQELLREAREFERSCARLRGRLLGNNLPDPEPGAIRKRGYHICPLEQPVAGLEARAVSSV
jgi:hypothetical protein